MLRPYWRIEITQRPDGTYAVLVFDTMETWRNRVVSGSETGFGLVRTLRRALQKRGQRLRKVRRAKSPRSQPSGGD